MAKTPGEKVEQWLRQWGAEEAVRQTRPAPMRPASAAPVEREVRPTFWSRYWPVAAGIVLCLVAAAVAGWPTHEAKMAAAPQPAGHATAPAAAATEPGGAEAALAAEQQKTLDLESKRAALVSQLTDATKMLESKMKESDELLRKLNDLQTQVDDRTARLAKFDEQIAQLKKEVDAQQASVADAKARLDEAVAARARVEKELTAKLAEADAAVKSAEAQAKAASAEQDALLAQLREGYLPAVTAGMTPLMARQEAARKNRLLERYAQLRPTITDPGVRATGEKLEALLTQLTLLDAKDAAKVSGFKQMLATVDPRKQIELALATPKLDATTRQWLVETELVLTDVK